ncbi:MAG: enoyl-CoA hydratase/isomerase family protein [Gammaproteobacteria bacterium]|nr:enoyl-CoA hydratase/isomerase family protein [Gammaproteobacteria bacterium]
MSSHFTLSESDGLIELVFDHPQKHNAIDLPMLEGLADALERLATKPELRVLLIRANGKYFSSGADVGSLVMPDLAGSPSRFRHEYRRGAFPLHDIFDEMELVEKPIVVAHQGPCLGGALEMSLSCDFRLAAESARYGLPEAAMGLLPGSGGTSRLTRLVGTHWARWLIIAGRQFSAQQALTTGLVHDVLPDEGFAEAARAFCRSLTRQPAEMIAAAKLSIELSKDLDRAQGRNIERLSNSSLIFGAEHGERIAALRSRLSMKPGEAKG